MSTTLRSRRALLGGAVAAAGSAALGCSRDARFQGRKRATLWFTYGGRNREVLEELVRLFNEGQSEHFVDAVYQGDYFEGLAKLRTAIFAKAAPSFSHVIGEVVPYLEEVGVLQRLEKLPGAGSLGIIAELGQEKGWVGGNEQPLVALPFNRSTPIAYLNGEKFHRAGLEAPRTWNEWRSVAKAFSSRAKSGARYGFGCPIAWWFWVAMVGQAGGQVIERDGRVSLGDEAGVKALRFWQTLVSEDHSMKPPPGRDFNAWEQTNQDFLAGRTAMIWTSTAFLKYLEDNAPFPVVAAPLPRDRRHAVPTGGTHWVMLKDTPDQEKETAWAFLRFMHEPEQTIHWATRTGYMPVTHAAVRQLERQGYYASHPNDRVAIDQLGVALPWPWSTQLFRIQREIVQPKLESAVLSGEDAGRLLERARREARGGG